MKAKNFFKRFAAIFLAATMLLGVAPMALLAQNVTSDAATIVEGAYPKSKTATDLYDDKYTDVTLKVGADEGDLSSDIVLIMGAGPASDLTYVTDMIKKILRVTDGTTTKVKFGLVTFADTTEKETVLPLTVMRETDPDNVAEDDMDVVIKNALAKAVNNYSGINLESALITARDMLQADTAVPAHRKHLIVVSTGLTYWFDDDNGNPSTVLGTNKFGTYMHGNKYWLQARNGSTNTSGGYKIPTWAQVSADGSVDYIASWENYWNTIVGYIENDQNAYVYTPGKTYSEFFYNGNSTEIRPNNNANYRYGYAIQNEEDIATVTGAVPFFAGNTNPAVDANAAHALNYERAQYESWIVFNQMNTPIGQSFETVLYDEPIQGLGYNCYSVVNGVSTNVGDEDRWLASNQIGYNFMQQLAGGKAIHYRDKDTSFFRPIENDILYSTLSNGSKVVDYIGYSADSKEGYNFDFIDTADKLTLKVGSVAYTAAKLEAAAEGATSSYEFTAPGAAEATFTLDYFKGNGTTEEHFVWTFNEPTTKYAPVSLTYTLELIERSEVTGTHDADTNQSATLYPKDSFGEEKTPEDFPVPTIKYEVLPVTVEGKKTWDDADDQDGKRPDSITIRLYADGEFVTAKTVGEADGWAWTFDNLDRFANGKLINYTITEDAIEDYNAVVDGFNVTNTHTPEETFVSVTKQWNDDNDRDGLRPDSITAILMADGKATGLTLKLSEENGWTAIFSDLPVYKNGRKITYTVAEAKVEGYTTKITGNATEGFVIVNTHAPEKTVVSGTKTWDDMDDLNGFRPESITIRLYANGVEIDSKTVTAKDNWEWTFANLNKYADGAEVAYTISEDAVEGYITVVDGYNVTNVHDPEFSDLYDPDVPHHPGDPDNELSTNTSGANGQVKPEPPQTGDNLILWMTAAIASGGLFTLCLAKRKKETEN